MTWYQNVPLRKPDQNRIKKVGWTHVKIDYPIFKIQRSIVGKEHQGSSKE
uniref:Uncharacterized protein n=1 Tax=Arundo donax TaxID=35708 RepID=A0A0A8Y7X3_ARUDO